MNKVKKSDIRLGDTIEGDALAINLICEFGKGEGLETLVQAINGDQAAYETICEGLKKGILEDWRLQAEKKGWIKPASYKLIENVS